MLIHPHLHHRRADRRFASAVAMQSDANAQGRTVRGGVGAFARMRNRVLVLAIEPTSQPRRCLLKRHSSGLTLIELLVVLVILAALAAIVVPNVTNLRIGVDINGEGGKTPAEIVTETTLLRVRAAIMGDESMPGLWQDLGGREAELPQTIAELFAPPAGWTDSFDPNTRLGWRGPYIQPTGAQLGLELAGLGYGNATDPAILDGWGRPIVIQDPGTLQIRLLSAGADADLGTSDDIELNLLTD